MTSARLARRILDTRQTFEAVWRRIEECQGQPFYLKRGGVFTYHVDGNKLFPDRTVWHTSKRNFEDAYAFVPFDGPGALREKRIVGASYVWAILHDPRIRYAAQADITT